MNIAACHHPIITVRYGAIYGDNPDWYRYLPSKLILTSPMLWTLGGDPCGVLRGLCRIFIFVVIIVIIVTPEGMRLLLSCDSEWRASAFFKLGTPAEGKVKLWVVEFRSQIRSLPGH
jgi:hypothetical protein